MSNGQELTAHQQPKAKAKKPDYSNPKKLGFMRVIIFAYGFAVVASIVIFMATSRDDIVYDLGTLTLFADVVLSGASIWLLVKRMRAARVAIIIMNVMDIVTSCISVALGIEAFAEINFSVAINILTIIYFLTSDRAKAVLVNSFSDENVMDKGMPTIKDPIYWRNLVLYYCIFSLVGHWMEAGFCMLIRAGIVAGSYDPSNTSLWRDWLYPFPPDGVGFVMCALILYPIKNWLQAHVKPTWLAIVPSFLINGFVCSLVELSFGLAVNANYQLWDYRPMAFNFMGQVCLQNSIGFGLVSTVITWALYPYIARRISEVPPKKMTLVFVSFIVFYAILQSLYLVNL